MQDTKTVAVQSMTVRSTGDSLLDQIDVALYAVDAAGLCVRINRAAERLLGYTQAEALGRNMHELVHGRQPNGELYALADCQLVQARSEHHRIDALEEILWSKDGQPVPVECSSLPVVMEDGTLGAVVTLKDLRGRAEAERHLRDTVNEQLETIRQRDATARVASDLAAEQVQRQRNLQLTVERAAAEQIREQQQFLGTVAERAPIGIAVFDDQVCYRWTNKSYLDAMDPAYRGINLRGTSFFATVAPANLGELRSIVEEVQRTGKTYVADSYALGGVQRGTTYWNWSLSRLENGDLMSTAANVTEQVSARREVEAVYANAPIALCLVDAKTRCYLRVNLQYADLMGASRDAMVGARVGAFSTSSATEDILSQAVAGKAFENYLLKLHILANPGAQRSVLVNVTPNRNDTGEVETLSIAIVDVTAQKRAEDALVQADKLAAVGRLAASISHEINNPLEAVTNLLYLVHQDPALSDESCTYIKQAEAELARVSQIASQTLRFQRHAVEAVPVMPNQLIDSVVALYQGRLKHTRIDVAVKYSGEQETMVVFEGDVRQILNNLLGNAIDAMTSSGGKITVRAKRACCLHTRRRGTRISIADTGHGMTKETADHIFEPFFTTKGSGGSGLGLWISHTLAQRHGGALRVRSCMAETHPRGKGGTVFSLFLPNLEVKAKAN